MRAVIRFVANHWKFLSIFAAAILFALFLWPTMYTYRSFASGRRLLRINRITQTVSDYDYTRRQWRRYGARER